MRESVAETDPTEVRPSPATPETGSLKPGAVPAARPTEIGGPKGPEPTRYGDWERKGRCVDF
ncbi:MAG: DUF1674 domain-containing protein [Gammaproteobacteria bacterium]|nr:DUF1674 domain-containing protein [Gammaproteobacteria bacterium]